MEQQVIYELLGKWGIENEKITKLINGDAEYNVQKAYEDMREHHIKIIENDPKITSRFKNEGKVELGNELKKSLVTNFQLSIPEPELESKGVHDILGIARRKMNEEIEGISKLSGDNDKILRELNEYKTKSVELQSQVNNYRDTVLPEYEKRLEDERKRIYFDSLLEKEIRKNEVVVSERTLSDYVAPQVIKQIRSLYDISQDDTGNLQFTVKGQGTKPVTKSGDRFLLPQEIIKNKLEEADVLKVSNAQTGRDGQPKFTSQAGPQPAQKQYEAKTSNRKVPNMESAIARLRELESVSGQI